MGGLIARRDLLKAAGAAAAVPRALEGREAGPAGTALDVYPGRFSYEPGETLALHVSTGASKYSAEIARVGSRRELVWSKQDIPGKQHAIPANASSNGCAWPPELQIPLPADWKSGYYSVSLKATGSDGNPVEADGFFVVRAGESASPAKILLQLTTNTYNAYNNWGGPCLYEAGPLPMQGKQVSCQRPMARGFLTKPPGKLSYWAPFAGWHNWERSFVAWAEQAGYQFDYAVNQDLEQHPELLNKYRLVLSVGHDEYWSEPMRDHLEAYIAGGGNVAFFSGNVCYWRVRIEDDGNVMVCYKSKYEKDPHFQSQQYNELTTLWSNRLMGRPENYLTGVSFNYGGYHRFGSVPR